MRMPPVLLWGRSPSAIVPQGVSWWICVGILVLLEPSAAPVPVSPWRRAPLGCLMPGCLGPLKTLAAPWRRAPQGCLVPAVVRSWRRAPGCLLPGSLLLGCLVPLKRVAAPWWPLPPDYLLPGRPGPRKTALESPWWRVPRGRLLPRRQGPSKAVRLWHHSSGLPVLGRRVPLTAPAATWGRPPLVLLLQGLLVPWKAAVRSWWRALLGCGLPCLHVPLKVLVSPWWQPPPSCLAPGRLGASQVAVAAS